MGNAPRLEQFFNRLSAEVHERERPTIRTRQVRVEIESQGFENCRDNFFWLHRPFRRIRANVIAFAHDAAAFHTAAGE